jgi:hypothetical protein
MHLNKKTIKYLLHIAWFLALPILKKVPWLYLDHATSALILDSW